MRKPLEFIAKWPTPTRRLLIWACQVMVICSALWLSFLLRFDLTLPPQYVDRILIAIPIWVIAKMIMFRSLRLDRGWWAGISSSDVVLIVGGNTLASTVCYVIVTVIARVHLPRSIYALDAILCFCLSIGVRESVRMLERWRWLSREREFGANKKVFIYGAGQAGIMLLHEIQRNRALPYRVCGFIDDACDKKGLRIAGIKVLGSGDLTSGLVRRFGVEVILIAIPSATGAQMARILQRCHDSGVECKTVPGLVEMLTGSALAGQIREVAVEDLLGRQPIVLSIEEIQSLIEDETVLVTGAGGSIGSELCRQIARFRPAELVGLEIAESALFEIDREMRQHFPAVTFSPEIGNIQNKARLAEVLGRYRPSVVFHAAAYKHVPMMEMHAFEAVENNVIGSYNLARASIMAGVRTFVLISTDKAVNPTNVMGVTKRITELLLLGMQSNTKFVAVRFGNVLGSNGSVIPIFKKQIASGGPVTVTHPEMRRFFMTIPEACQLVLQAATSAESGQICVLQMGEPVKIVDLAMNLILLSGLTPHKDIEIRFTGIRPGEKLSEELSSYLESCRCGPHEKIMIYAGNATSPGNASAWVAELAQICRDRDPARLVLKLKEIVSDYNPSEQLLRLAIHGGASTKPKLIRRPNVVPMPLEDQEIPLISPMQSLEDAASTSALG